MAKSKLDKLKERELELEKIVDDLYKCFESLEDILNVSNPAIREVSSKAMELFNKAEVRAHF